MTYCVECGSDDTVQSETGNYEGELFAAEDMNGSIEYYSELEVWFCYTCTHKFFK